MKKTWGNNESSKSGILSKTLQDCSVKFCKKLQKKPSQNNIQESEAL